MYRTAASRVRALKVSTILNLPSLIFDIVTTICLVFRSDRSSVVIFWVIDMLLDVAPFGCWENVGKENEIYGY